MKDLDRNSWTGHW